LLIRNPDGSVAWQLGGYDFLLDGKPRDSINPSLQRQALLNLKYGLFEVAEGIYQVRGFDLANITFIRGDSGWIVVDTLTTPATARAAYELVSRELGERPIRTVIYSHAHADHFGGVRGLVEPQQVASGAVQALPFDDCDGSLTWANDNRTLFFGELDDTHRPHKLYRHRLGEAGAELVFEEGDGRFFLHCYRSSSERQLILLLNSKTTSEAWVLDADQPQGTFRCLAPREEGHEYYPDHGRLDGRGLWLIRSNQAGINFALYQAEESRPTREHWQLRVAHDPQRTLEDVSLNAEAVILGLRDGGLPVIEVQPQGLPAYRVQLPDAAYSLYVQDSLEFDSPCVRLRYEALNRPAQVRQLNLADGTQTVLKQTPVEGPFDADAYASRRIWASSGDGTQVPVSLVARKEVLDGIAAGRPAPLYLYGYGAYGHSLDPWFSHARLSLLERGFVFAIAHVRGGGELGEAWYRAGKLEHKQNSFDDFIACAEHLLAEGYCRPEGLAISGGSAGGLLIGAVLNQRPQLFGAAIAEVPFVDVLNSMLNPDLPLTVTEYDEWGNPQEPEVHARIAAYAPYENVRAQDYPHLLVVAGYNDSRVQYWEAAKWVAKLRATRTDANLLLLKTDLGAGHGGMSGRYQGLKDVALEYAFLLKVLGLV
ncbi:MAG: prolyl oligopeptidase family serine peptidase, partial [Enterobacter sp.]|nr:prolyl oligopeptidase family serine peptidase [Enterobacter sp.]